MFSWSQLFATPWTVTCQAPLSMEFSRQEYWSGLPFSIPGQSSWARDQNLSLQHWQADSLPLCHLRRKSQENKIHFSSVQFSSVAQLCPTLCDPINRSTPGPPVHHQLPSSPKLMCIKWVMPSSHLILCRPLLFLPPMPPSIRVFSNESALHMRWPKYWSFSLSVSPSSEHPGLISFRMDWLDLLAVQGTPKSLLQLPSSIAPIPQCSAFFTVQLSHP